MKILSAFSFLLLFAASLAQASYTPTPYSVAKGGTGASSFTLGSILLGNGTSAFSLLGGTDNTVVLGHTGAAPTMGQVTNAYIANTTIDLTAKVTGILPNANTTATSASTNSAIVARDSSGNFSANQITAGLTGTASGNLSCSPTNHGVLISGSGNTPTVTAVGATNTVFHGNTGADPSFSAIVNADITNATIDLSTKVSAALLSAANLPAPALSTISAVDIDWSLLKNTDGAYTKTLSASITLTFSNIVAGQTIVIFLTNTASNYTVAWPGSAHFPAATAPTQTVGAKLDVITCKAVSTSVAYCQSVQNFTP